MQFPKAVIRIGTCFEYTKTDKVTPKLKGKTGYGAEKTCKSLNMVKSWQNSVNYLCSI